MTKIKIYSSGFTLIEMLVVVSILMIFMGIGIASYAEYNRKQIVAQTAAQVLTYLRLAQSKAISGEKNCGNSYCGGVNNVCTTASKMLNYWTFNPALGEIYGTCGGDTNFNNTKFFIPSGLTINIIPSSLIRFYPLTGGASSEIICLNNTAQNYHYKISIDIYGGINDEGFVSSCP